jgi:hypothetical protein
MTRTASEPSRNGKSPHQTKAEIEAAAEKPKALSVRPDGIPTALRKLDQWVCWCYERRREKWTKRPIDPKNGRAASSTDPATWGMFDEAMNRYRQHGDVAGVGFVFTEEDPFVGVDLDDARDVDTRELAQWAIEMVRELDSYAEISPSRTGVKLFLKAKVPPGGNRKGHIEIYDHDRFFAVTGRKLANARVDVRRRQQALDRLHAEVFKPSAEPAKVAATPAGGDPLDPTDDELIHQARAAKNGAKFAALWAGDTSGHNGDKSAADQALCNMLARWTRGDAERIDRLFRRSGLYRHKWERADYRQRTIDKAVGSLRMVASPGKGSGEKAESQASQLVKLAEAAGCELWHNPDREPFATLPADQYHANCALASRTFRLWLAQLYYTRTGKNPNSHSLQDAANTLGGHAVFSGPEHRIHTRLAEHDGRYYLDLCNDHWQVVEVGAGGWRVLDRAPVRFRRTKGMRPLPAPARGGSLEELRPFVRAATEDEWRLRVAYLLATLKPTGPYPILVLCGEQGSGKSSEVKVLRDLVDPNAAPLRSPPRDERDLWIAAANSWTVCLNNVSFVPDWLSDSLCRLATDGGFSTRRLYENDEEVIFDGLRPVFLNGIEDFVARGDLLDRCITLTVRPLDDRDRRTEKELKARFEEVRPRVLGALLDVVAGGLRDLPGVKLDRLPRLADFCTWVTACERSLGWQPGVFLRTYERNRQAATETALEASVVAKHVSGLLKNADTWSGTATELLAALETRASEADRHLKSWPQGPRGLSGHLRRVAPSLRKCGIDVDFRSQRVGSRIQRIITLSRISAEPSTSSTPSTTQEKPRERVNGRPADVDGRPGGVDGRDSRPSTRKPPRN